MVNENKQVVYLVKQTQYDIDCSDIGDCYVGTTIYVCSDEQEATRRARKLNKQYGSGCIFTDDWDFDEEWDYLAKPQTESKPQALIKAAPKKK